VYQMKGRAGRRSGGYCCCIAFRANVALAHASGDPLRVRRTSSGSRPVRASCHRIALQHEWIAGKAGGNRLGRERNALRGCERASRGGMEAGRGMTCGVNRQAPHTTSSLPRHVRGRSPIRTEDTRRLRAPASPCSRRLLGQPTASRAQPRSPPTRPVTRRHTQLQQCSPE
jgi:hypothetical protein